MSSIFWTIFCIKVDWSIQTRSWQMTTSLKSLTTAKNLIINTYQKIIIWHSMSAEDILKWPWISSRRTKTSSRMGFKTTAIRCWWIKLSWICGRPWRRSSTSTRRRWSRDRSWTALNRIAESLWVNRRIEGRARLWSKEIHLCGRFTRWWRQNAPARTVKLTFNHKWPESRQKQVPLHPDPKWSWDGQWTLIAKGSKRWLPHPRMTEDIITWTSPTAKCHKLTAK